MKSPKLIKEYVKFLVEAAANPLFKIRDLKKLKSPREVIPYADEHLERLGKGSSRVVYRIGPRKVLKVALNTSGLAQNEAEVDIYTSPRTKRIVSRIYDYDSSGYGWLISEIVREFEVGEFVYEFDVDFDVFCGHFKSAVKSIKSGELGREDWEEIYGLLDEDAYPSESYYDFFEAVLTTALNGNLLPGDICYEQHWGRTADDRVVLYDYGFTESVRDEHYTSLKSDSAEEEFGSGPEFDL